MEAAGLNGAGTLDGFTDANEVSAQYADCVKKAVAAGVVKGYEDGTLRPKETIAHAEALVLLSRCLPELTAARDALVFSDVPAWAKADVDRLSAAGLVTGYGDGSLGANNALTVDQVGFLTARAVGKNLLGAVEAANSPARIFMRHTTAYRHEEVCSRGEHFFTDDLYSTADSVYYFFGKDYICYITPTEWVDRWADTGELRALLMPTEENAAELLRYQSYIAFKETELLDAVENLDNELIITTRITDEDAVSDYLEAKRSIYGDSFETQYGRGVELDVVYHVDAASLELKELSETLRLPDGSEIPSLMATFAYDTAIPNPTAPDSALAYAFDETAKKWWITVIYAPGTPEEQTCRYSMAESVKASILYHGDWADIYEDAACTQPFTGRNGRTELTIYVKPATEPSKLAAQYEALLPDLGVRAEEWNAEMSKCTEEEQKIMQYYFVTTTMSDLCSIDFSLLRSYASHAVMLRETMPWTKALDEDTFLCYVASYHVFREPTVDCRPFFYNQVSGLLKGKSLTEAVLQVNKWCGEQATYAESDQREASPLGMYNGGMGRCGEEANFVVNVLRNVGIPARVCNVDWTVVADGHAFPQVLVDGEWHFVGACEPAPVLDNGWFTSRLGSLLDAQSYTFSDIGVEQALPRNDGLFAFNHVEDFTDTKVITLTVLDEQGQPAPNVSIDLVLIQNELYIMTIETLVTDKKGEAHYTLGRGSVSAVAYRNGDWRGVWIEQDQTEATISFAEQSECNVWISLPVRYSEAETKRVQNYTEEENTAFFGGADFNAVRTENHANDFDAERAAPYPDCDESLRSAGRNFGELIAFPEKDDNPMRSYLVAGLSDKYTREVSAEVLEDILQGALKVRGELSDEDFVNGLLYPVSEWSYFTPQRLAVQQMFTEEQLRDFRANPSMLYQWFAVNIHDDCLRAAKGGMPALSSALKMGYCPESVQTMLLMDLARAVGIPVQQDAESEQWLTLGADNWIPVDWSGTSGESQNDSYGTVQYLAAGSEAYEGLYWTILGLSGDNSYDYYHYWLVENTDVDSAIELPVGEYAMVLLNMQEEKSGTLYICRFTVEKGRMTTLSLPS